MNLKKPKEPKKRIPPVIPKPGPPALPALPPLPALPAPVKAKSRRPAPGTKLRQELQQVKDKLEAKQVKATHLVTAAGGAVASTLSGAMLVRYDLLSPLWASLLLTLSGASMAAAGWYYDSPYVLWGGSGWSTAGAAHTTMAIVADRASKQTAKPRNGAMEEIAPRQDARECLRLSEERRRELERELAKARRQLNPEAELAAA